MAEQRFGPVSEAWLLKLLAVIELLLSSEVPEVWETARRLVVAGLASDDVTDRLTMAFALKESRGAESFDRNRYVATADRWSGHLATVRARSPVCATGSH